MGYYLSEPAPSKGDLTAKNRVWGFFAESVSVSLESRRAARKPHRENYDGPGKTVSGIPLWPSRDPIGERGGINLYGFIGNDGLNWIDLLGWIKLNSSAGGVGPLNTSIPPELRDQVNRDYAGKDVEPGPPTGDIKRTYTDRGGHSWGMSRPGLLDRLLTLAGLFPSPIVSGGATMTDMAIDAPDVFMVEVPTLEQTNSLWLVLSVSEGLLSDSTILAMTNRVRDSIIKQATAPRRKRNCPRKIRQPVSSWPRLTANESNEGDYTFEITTFP